MLPLDQGPPVVVAEVHTPRVLEENVQVVPGLPRRLDAGLGEVDGPVGVRKGPGLLAPGRGRQDDVGEPGGLREEDVLDYDEELLLLEYLPYAAQFGEGDGGVRAADPEQIDRALLGVAEDLHRVGGRRPVRDLYPVHVPQVGELLDVLLVVPVAKGGQVPVGTRLAGVLRAGLAVELQDAAARPTQHATHEVDVVYLARGRRRLVRLVDALQGRGEEPVRGADDARGLPDLSRLDPADPGRPLGRAPGHGGLQLLEADRVRPYVLLVVPPVPEDLVQEGVEERHVGAVFYREVHRGLFGHGRGPRVNHDELRGLRAAQPVEDAHPGDGLGLGHIVAEEHDGVGVVDVGVGTWLPVAAEALFQGLRGGGGAEAGVAVHVRRPQTGLADDAKSVVLLKEELARGVEAEGQRTLLFEQPFRALDDAVHRLVPARLDELAGLPDQRPLQAVLREVSLPAEKVLGIHPAFVDPVHAPAPNPHHAPVLDRDVVGVTVGVEDGGRLNPAVHLVLRDALFEELVNPDGPLPVPPVRRAAAPWICYAIRQAMPPVSCSSGFPFLPISGRSSRPPSARSTSALPKRRRLPRSGQGGGWRPWLAFGKKKATEAK